MIRDIMIHGPAAVTLLAAFFFGLILIRKIVRQTK